MGPSTVHTQAAPGTAHTDATPPSLVRSGSPPDERQPGRRREGGARAGLRALARFWPLTRGDRCRLAAVSASVVVTALAETAAVLLFGHLTDVALQTGSLAAYWGPAAAWLAVGLVASVVGFGGNYLGAWVGERFILRLRAQIFAHLHRLPADFFQRHRPGDLVERLTGDVAAVEELTVSGTIGIASALVNIVLFGAALVWLRWDMALAALAAAPVFWLTARCLSDRVEAAARAQRAADGAVSAVVEESLRGVAVRRTYGHGHGQEQRLEAEAQRWLRACMASVRLEEGYHQLVVVLESTCVLALLGLGTWEVGHHRMTIGQLLSFAGFLGCLYPPLQSLGRTALAFTSAAAAADRVAEIWDTPQAHDPQAQHRDQAHDPQAQHQDGAAPIRTHRRTHPPAMEFAGVAVRPPGADQDLLRDIDLTLRTGRTVVLSGPSGAGKSTLARLALRLGEPTRGSLLLHGQPLHRIPTEHLHTQITLVPQHTDLLHATVAENIALARPDATGAHIHDAARQAGLHEVLSRLPGGYHTVLDPQQPQLSTGELRLLALARAFLRDAPIWILDEPTAGLDPHTAHTAAAAIRRTARHRAVLIHSHEPWLYPWADTHLVLQAGHLAKQPVPADAGPRHPR